MGNKHPIADYEIGTRQINLSVKLPTPRYIDEFMRCKCAPDLLLQRVFPNAKEITESFAAYNAVRKVGKFDWGDERVSLISVADGSTPRTAATFAFRSRWSCFSIDPNLGSKDWESQIDRLSIIKERIENVDLNKLLRISRAKKAVFVAVHPHTPLNWFLSVTINIPIMLVVLPCCVEQILKYPPPDIEYHDWGIWSPKRRVMIWDDPFKPWPTNARSSTA